MAFKRIIIVPAVIFPFLYLTLSLCCMGMGNTNTHAMAGMASGYAIQKGISFNGDPCQSSKFQCEKLTENYDNAKISVDLQKFTFPNPKLISLANTSFSTGLIHPVFFNYESPPKLVQNSLPLFLQISVLRL